MKMLLLLSLGLLMACTSSGETAQALLDKLEFDADDVGCVDLRAEVDLNPAPFFTSRATLIYKKNTGADAPTC